MASAIDQFSSGLENTNCWRVGGGGDFPVHISAAGKLQALWKEAVFSHASLWRSLK